MLAAHYKIDVMSVSKLRSHGLSMDSLEHLLGEGADEFSAALIESEGSRLIIHNPAHSVGRSASNIVHEIAHLLLKHEPTEDAVRAGCRKWDAAMESEADWLAGELLVPSSAALDLARQDVDIAEAAAHFGVSVPMLNWRMNESGARIRARREREARARYRT